MSTGRKPRRSLPRRRAAIWAGCALILLLLGVAGFGAATGFFDTDPGRLYPARSGQRQRVAALFLSGDLGLRFGMGARLVPALAAHDIPVYAISSSTAFRAQRSQAFVDALVANSARQALDRSGADRLLLIGQSFGSDILVAGAGALPPDLRARVAALVLVVPGRSIFFRADPTELRYRGAADADGVVAVRSLGWAHLICIYGQRETDSLCPLLRGRTVQAIALPGGHLLNRDPDRLIRTLFDALRPILRH